MSHVIKIKTKLMDQDILCNALTRLDMKYQVGRCLVHGTEAQVFVDEHFGFARQADNTWSMVGDPYYSSDAKVKSYYGKEDQLTQDVNNAYAVEEAIEHMEEQGYQLVENEDSNNQITLIFEN